MKKGLACDSFGRWKAIQNNMHLGDQGRSKSMTSIVIPENFDLSQSHPHLVDQAKKIFKTASLPSEHYFWNYQQIGENEVYDN